MQIQEKLRQKEKDMSRMVEELTALRSDNEQLKRQLLFFQVKYKRTLFTYDNVITKGQCFYVIVYMIVLNLFLNAWYTLTVNPMSAER